MNETLKILIASYREGLMKTPNFQVIDKIFSYEVIHFTETTLSDSEIIMLNITLCRFLLKKSKWMRIKFFNVSFESGVFTKSVLENCLLNRAIQKRPIKK
jgi:hypothetical protein